MPRGQGQALPLHFLLHLTLCPRRRTLGASPHSVGFQSHAFSPLTSKQDISPRVANQALCQSQSL